MASLASDDLSVDGQPSAEPTVPHRLSAPAALLVGAVLVGGAGAVGVIETSGATAPTSVPAAVWVVALPGILAAVLTVIRPVLGAAFAGGAGALAAVRLLTDLFVLTEPDQVARPEFYFPSSTQVHAVGTSALGAALLIVGDLLLVAGGVLGLRTADRSVRDRLAPIGLPRRAPGVASAADRTTPTSSSFFGSGPVPEPDGLDGTGPPASLNVRMVAVGLLGVAVAVVLTVQVPYVGGYLDDFYSIPSDLGSTLGPFLLALLSAGVVIRAAGFPRAIATALLAGSAAMFLVPMLTAVLSVSGGARTTLATPPLFLPIGLLVMIGAGLLSAVQFADPAAPSPEPIGRDATSAPKSAKSSSKSSKPSQKSAPKSANSAAPKARAARAGARSEPGRTGGAVDQDQAAHYAVRPSEPIGLVGAGLAALAGIAAVLAPQFGMLRVNATAPGVEQQGFLRTGPVVGSGVDSVLTVPAIIAGVSLIGCAIVVLLGRLLRRESVVAVARMASVPLVILPLVALAGPLSTLAVLSTGQAQTASTLSDSAPAGIEVDLWSSGPGVWSLVAALALGIAAATCSSIALTRNGEEMTWGPDDDAADAGRRRRWSVAAGVVALAILSTSVTVWELPQGTASTVFAGDAAWTCWLLVLGAAVAAVVIASAQSPAVVVGAAVGAAILLASRLIIPSGVSGTPGFVRPWGWYLGWVAVLAVLGLGVLAARWVVTTAREEAPMGSAPHVDNRPKPIRGR